MIFDVRIEVWQVAVVVLSFAISLAKIHTDLYWIKKNLHKLWQEIDSLRGD